MKEINENKSVKKGRKMSLAVCLLVLCLVLGGCSADKYESYEASVSDYSNRVTLSPASAMPYEDDEMYYSEAMDAEPCSADAAMDYGTATTAVTFAKNKKIIYQSDVVMETMTYEETYLRLIDLINKYSGYIEFEKYDNQLRSFLTDNTGKGKIIISTNHLKVRVPSVNYSTFMQEGLSLGNVLSRNQTISDKTSEYNTNKSYVDILTDEAEYLAKQLEVLESELKEAQAGDKHYDDIITNMKHIAERKAQVEKELVPYKRVMDDIDEKVEYSTIIIELREVNEYTKVVEPVVEEEPTFGDRIAETWNDAMDSLVSMLQSVFLFLIDIIPVLVAFGLLGILFLIVWKIVRGSIKRKRRKRNAAGKASDISKDYAVNSNMQAQSGEAVQKPETVLDTPVQEEQNKN